MVSKLFLTAAALGLMAGAIAQKPIVPQAIAGRKIEPVRFAKAKIVNGKAYKAGPWINVQNKPTINSPSYVAYDAIEVDASGNTVNDRWGNPVTDLGAGSRWFFGPDYQNSFAVNDMTVANGYAGKTSELDSFAFYWGITGDTGDVQCYVALFTAEDFGETDAGTGGVDPAYDNAYDGILWDFGPQTKNSGFFSLALGDLTGSGLSHQLPMDGRGAVLMVLADAINGDGSLVISTGQPMLWGTDRLDGSSTNPSFQNEFQWDDDFPVDGTHTAPDEFYSYAFGLQTDPLGATVGMFSNTQALHAASAAVQFGINQTGTPADTHTSDDTYFSNDRGITPGLAFDPPTITWTMDGAADRVGVTFSQLDILIEARTTKVGIRQIIEARDQDAGGEPWIVLGVTTETLGNGTDTTHTRSTTTNVNSYVEDADGTVEIRTRYRPTLPLFNPNYSIKVDHLVAHLTK